MIQTAYSPRPLDREALRAAYLGAAPFRHVVIDNFFEEADALAIHRAFPRFDAREEAKARLFSGRVFGPPPPDRDSPAFSGAFAALASRAFAADLAAISGIAPLAMDQTHAGAGIHMGLRGSTLPIHADHNTHPGAPWLYRRLNLLVYLNPNWQPSWASDLLLYDRSGTTRVRQIESRFNRAVLMEVSDRAFHGYHALNVPPGHARQSLALYYYSPERSLDQAADPHDTIFGDPVDLGVGERVAERLRRTVVHRFRRLLPSPSWSEDD